MTKALQTWSLCKQSKHKVLIQYPGIPQQEFADSQLGNRSRVSIWVQPKLAHPVRKSQVPFLGNVVLGWVPEYFDSSAVTLDMPPGLVPEIIACRVYGSVAPPINTSFPLLAWCSLGPLFFHCLPTWFIIACDAYQCSETFIEADVGTF